MVQNESRIYQSYFSGLSRFSLYTIRDAHVVQVDNRLYMQFKVRKGSEDDGFIRVALDVNKKGLRSIQRCFEGDDMCHFHYDCVDGKTLGIMEGGL